MRERLASLAALLTIVLLASLAAAQDRDDPLPPPEDDPPTHGRAGPGLEHFDALMHRTMERFGVPGASLAIAKDGKLVLAKGYGWADIEAHKPVLPGSHFLLASVSKVLTAVTILKLVDDRKLSLDDRAFELLGHLRPPSGEQRDPRLRDITVRMLLNHSGGWDRDKSGDPEGFGPRVARKLHVRQPVTAVQLTRFMLGQPLDFDPGTEQVYSNFGFIVLGVLIEHVSGESYEECVHHLTLRPMGIRGVRLDTLPPHYAPGEARRYGLGGDHEYHGGHAAKGDAAGGWLATAPELALFLTALDGSRGKPFLAQKTLDAMLAPPLPPLKIRDNGSYFGLGWDRVQRLKDGFEYSKNGGDPGISTLIEHLPNGINWVLLLNASGHAPLLSTFRREMHRAFADTKKWPDTDLFRRPP